MSIRVYRPSVSRKRRGRGLFALLSWFLATVFIAMQIAYPLLSNEPLRLLTIATVYVGAAASLAHAWTAYGFRYVSIYAAITGAFGALIELSGVHTGWPFGEYSYSPSLGAQVAGVPLVVPFAWVMMAHPALVAARRLNQRWAPVIAAWALMSWDIFLDPLMVDAGHWTWARSTPAIVGVDGIPLSNFAGWLLAGLILMFALDQALSSERRSAPASIAPVAAIYIWVYLAGIIGNIFFFNRPSLALVGGISMGLVALPYMSVLWWSRR